MLVTYVIVMNLQEASTKFSLTKSRKYFCCVPCSSKMDTVNDGIIVILCFQNLRFFTSKQNKGTFVGYCHKNYGEREEKDRVTQKYSDIFQNLLKIVYRLKLFFSCFCIENQITFCYHLNFICIVRELSFLMLETGIGDFLDKQDSFLTPFTKFN